ncbi:hypothetical protein PV797_10995 [Clostridiaceae bacterium M8S5]|nr:hypothetical protein PV797_10995 [Clostridiaceae bacterium M8S5]
MKKSSMIEIIIYIVLIIFGLIALIFFKPKEIEFEIPKQFEIEYKEGVSMDDTLSNK